MKTFLNDIITEDEETPFPNLQMDAFYNYLFYLEQTSKKEKLCSNFNDKFEIIKAPFLINISQKIYYIENKYKIKITNFLNSQKCNIIICPIILGFQFEKSTKYHINLIIIDKNEKTIQHFEPHGNSFIINKNTIHNNISGYIKNILDREFKIKTLTPILKTLINMNVSGSDYDNYYDFIEHNIPCGLQSKVSHLRQPNEGFCVGWVLLIIHCYLYNKGSINFITTFLLDKFNSKELNSIILKYVNMVYNHMHNNNNIIKIIDSNDIQYKHATL